MASTTSPDLTRRAARLEHATIAWNVIEGIVAIASGLAAASIALIGFGLDSFVEVFAATVVLWQLRGVTHEREARADHYAPSRPDPRRLPARGARHLPAPAPDAPMTRIGDSPRNSSVTSPWRR